MALLGTGGILELSREWPEPMALASAAINFASSPRTISLSNDRYWSGDRVLLNFPDGSPYDGGNPSGRAMYFGSIYELSAAKAHVTALDDQYYQVSDSVLFYDTTAVQTTASGYIYIDPLGRIRLFTDELSARNLTIANEKALSLVSTGNFVLSRYSANATYTSAVTSAANSIRPLLLPSASQPLEDVITVPAGFALVSDDPDQRGWVFQCDLEEWALDINASSLDITAIGETFGEQVKALVRGAGTMQFIANHRYESGEQDSLTLLRLVLLTELGGKSSAKFHLHRNRAAIGNDISGTLYYGCDILLTNSKLNVRAGDMITGTADFVVTGNIDIRVTA